MGILKPTSVFSFQALSCDLGWHQDRGRGDLPYGNVLLRAPRELGCLLHGKELSYPHELGWLNQPEVTALAGPDSGICLPISHGCVVAELFSMAQVTRVLK